MKKLDEVIKAMENCYGPDAECCDKCQYTKEISAGSICLKCNLEDDALHYLREYRETVTKCNQLRTGIWVPIDSETVNGRCSVCGYESHLYENDVYGEHYCPNCGARLRLT